MTGMDFIGMGGEVGMSAEDLIGKTIETIDVDGFSIEITFTDGTGFVYIASDGGYSHFAIYDGKEE